MNAQIISVADRPITLIWNLDSRQKVSSSRVEPFFRCTGGSWIFVLDKDGKKAYRRKIKIGRQNRNITEVIDGLEAGEKVIVSSYESYKDNEVLVLE